MSWGTGVGADDPVRPKNQNAITLIALVITIIVLLILAGVALSLVVGEDGITARAIKSRDVHNIAGIEEKANLAYHDSLIGGYAQDGVYHQVTLGDILSTLKTDGDIEDFGTTESSSITGISLGMDSLDLAVGGSQTLTVSSTAGDAGDYYVQYEGQKYLAHLENGNIVIDKDPMGDGGSSFEISNVSSSNSAVTAEKVGTNQVTVTGSSRGSSTVTVSYGSITATLNVTVKQNVTVSVSSEDTTKGTVTALAQNTYLEGSTITLSATPASGYKLDGWYIGTTKQTLGTGDVYTVPTDGTSSVALVAKFVEKPNIAVGSTVTYYPAGATYTWMGKYATTAEITETTEGGVTKYTTTDDVELSSNISGNYRITSWKVLSFDENAGMIEIVPASQPPTIVKLQGANGYNNAVYLLNEACKTLFVNSSAEITADDVRSIKVEDIENAMTDTSIVTAKNSYNHNSTSSNGHLNSEDQLSTPYTSTNYYPLIYAQENNSVINGNKNTSGWGFSRQDSLIERGGTTSELQTSGSDPASTTKTATNGYIKATTNIRPYQTYYYMSLSSSNAKTSAHSTVLCPSSNNYWVASRFVHAFSNACAFCVDCVFGSYLDGYGLFGSGGTFNVKSRALFPVVSLSSELLESDGGTGYRLISQRSITQ